MTFPQPSSTQPVKDGQQFFRLNTLVESSGDMYESEVSALAFVLGPESDISRVRVTYMDPDNLPTQVSQAIISPDRSLTGLVSAYNTETYISSFAQTHPRKGRILISIDEYYNPRFRPGLFDAGGAGTDSITYVSPRLDVMQYFKPLPSVVPPRSDRLMTFQYMALPVVAGNASWLMVPTYGRKSGFLTFNNLDGINTVTVTVTGVKFQPTSLGVPAGGSQGTIMAANPLITNSAAQVKYLASTMGLWDYFAIQLGNYAGAAMPISITLSDDAE